MLIKSRRILVKEAKEKLIGCTCKTCKFFKNTDSRVKGLMGWPQDGGVCSKKHKDWMDYFVAQTSASDSENDYCWMYTRGEK